MSQLSKFNLHSAFSDASDLKSDDALSLSTTSGLVVFIIGIVFTVGGTTLITIHTRRKLGEIFEKQKRAACGNDNYGMQSPLLDNYEEEEEEVNYKV